MRPNDFKLLEVIERWMCRYEFVPSDKLPALSGLVPKKVGYHLTRLSKFKLIIRQTTGYIGYKLSPAGHDALALRELVEHNVLEKFGTPLGIGKEADIYDALTPDGTKIAVKFNRLGRTSFTRVRLLRPYPPRHGWMYASRLAAKREFKALQKLYPHVSVPQPIACDRHVLVTGLIDGIELADVKGITEPDVVLDDVLENVKRSYKLGVVHADLSEHNIIIKPNGEVLIIDWPQYLPVTNPRASELLERDIRNVLKYFKRKFGLRRDLDQTLKFVKST
jgi:RIO kinase 2